MKSIISMLYLFLIFSCNKSSPKLIPHQDMMPSAEPTVETQAMAASADMSETKERFDVVASPSLMMVKEGVLVLEVEHFKESSKQLPSFLSSFEAYITEENQGSDLYTIRSQYTIRVPAARFDTLMLALQSTSLYTEQKSISSKDVTEEYIDIEARLKTKKIYEEKYFQLLNKAKNLTELIEIQNQLRAIREEIESMEGRKKYIESRVSMSTIHLTLFEKTDYQYTEKENGFFYRFKKSWLSGWDTALNITFGILSMWPIIILFSIFVVLIRLFYQKKKSP